MRVIGLLAILLFVSTPMAFAQDFALFVETDKSHYSQGDNLHISGRVDQNKFGTDVNLMIISPGGDVILIDHLPVHDKIFETNVKIGKNLFQSTGDYTILTRYGPEMDSTPVTLTDKQYSSFLASNDPKKNVLLNFDFIKPNKKGIQEHVDYKVTVSQNGSDVYRPSTFTHSSSGSVSLPLEIHEGKLYDVLIEVNGIMFQQIPSETASFKIMSPSKTIQTEFTGRDSLKIHLALNKDPSPEPKVIPEWTKNTAKWWALGKIDDETFAHAVEFLIQEKIVDIPNLPYPASWMDKSVPAWVKNNASWWADDLIQEDEFIKGIKFLVEKGVIQVNTI